METFNTRQTAVIASATKTVYWLFRIIDNSDNVYYYSTGTYSGTTSATITSGAIESAYGYSGLEWEYPHSFKIINFSGITLRRSKSEDGIHAPNDVTFSISNESNTLDASDFQGGSVRISIVGNDGNGLEIISSWRFKIRSASPYNQQIDITCEDFLQQYLEGSYPNTRLVSEIFPFVDDSGQTIQTNCVPEPYGTCYIPLQCVYASDGRYYFLGPSTYTYTITEVRSPRSMGAKITWTSGTSTFTQSNKTASDSTIWKVFQPIIADSDLDGTADANGLWLNGSQFLDMPTEFTRSDTASMTSPADIIRRVLINMGLSDTDLHGPSFDTARTTYSSWGLTWNFAFWYKQSRREVLSNLLSMCHSCLIVGEQIKLQVISKTSQANINYSVVLREQEDGAPSYRYEDSLSKQNANSGYVAFQQSGESQDLFQKALVPAKSVTTQIDNEVIAFPGVQDTQKVQKLGTLHFQRKLLKSANIQFNAKGSLLALRPDDVISIKDRF